MWREKINCLEGECSAYLSPMGWPGIYSICFSQLDDDKDSPSLDGGFYAFITVRLIRIIMEQLLRIILLSLVSEI